MKLVIFDLDQTLVDFISVHDEVMLKLFKKYFQVDARLTEIDFAGRNLSDNVTELRRIKNIPETTFNRFKDNLLSEYETVFNEITPEDGSHYILPGAQELLEELSGKGHIIALYTGSPARIVKRVFETTGLGKYFNISFTGSEEKTRDEMVQAAVNRAEKMTGKRFIGKDIVVIGDSVRDIEAGKHVNALTIAVTTGFHSREALLKNEPDYLFENLSDTNKILKAIESV